MENLEVSKESMTEETNKNKKLERKVLQILECIKFEENKEFRQKLVESIFNCNHGEEIKVISKMCLSDDDSLRNSYPSIYNNLQEALACTAKDYIIDIYDSVGAPLRKNFVILNIYSPSLIDEREVACNIKNALESSKHFKDVRYSRNSPIICSIHDETGTLLRIEPFEPYDKHNSDFFKQLKQADSRINDLINFLMAWFKHMGIYMFIITSKYCLMTLIAFYLQKCKPPVLLPIHEIERITQKRPFGNNVQLNLGHIQIEPNTNVQQLIQGFFEFYNSIEFETLTIAPYLGKMKNRAYFAKRKLIYPEYEAQLTMLSAISGKPAQELQIDSAVCIQDMFYLNRNIANRISESDLLFFKKCIALAHNKCREANTSKKLYKALLINILEELEISYKFNYVISFDLQPKDSELKSLVIFKNIEINCTILWVKAYFAAIRQIISVIYKINMKLVLEGCELKKIDENLKLPYCVQWFLNSTADSVDLWTGRQIPKSSPTFMEDQLRQTEKLYAERRHKSEFGVKIKGLITLTINKNFTPLVIKVSYNETTAEVKDLEKFSNSLKFFMRSYNLKYRIHLLESQLKANN